MRRYWLTAIALLVSLSGMAQAQSDAIPIIDAHTHTSFTGATEPATGRPQTMEQYFRACLSYSSRFDGNNKGPAFARKVG